MKGNQNELIKLDADRKLKRKHGEGFRACKIIIGNIVFRIIQL